MTDPNPSQESQPQVNIAIGADVRAFVSAIAEARRKAEADLASLDTTGIEARMDALYREMANQSIAWAQQNGKSIDAMIEKLQLYGQVQEQEVARMKTLMSQAAASIGMLTREESIGKLFSEVNAAMDKAVAAATKDYTTEFADIPQEQLALINSEMYQSIGQSARLFADTWGMSISEVTGILKANFTELDQGLASLLARTPGTTLSKDLNQVVPVSQKVQSEIARIDALLQDMYQAKRMGPVAALQTFGSQLREAAATSGISVAGKTSEEIFGTQFDANYIATVDKIIARLEGVRGAYLGINEAEQLAAVQAGKMSQQQLQLSNDILLVSGGMKNLKSQMTDLNTQINVLQRSMAQTPEADWVPKEKRHVEDLQNQLKQLRVQYQQLEVTRKRIASGAMAPSVAEEAMMGVTLHPSSLLASKEQLQGRALQQVLANAGVSDIEAYALAFAGQKGDLTDLGAKHGTMMHQKVQSILSKSLPEQTNKFEMGFKTQWKGFNLAGSMDWVDSANNIISDFKAIGDKEWAQLSTAVTSGDFTKIPTNLKQYIVQLESYARAFQQMTGQMPDLRFFQLPTKNLLKQYGGDYQRMAEAAAKEIQAGTRPSVTWKPGAILKDADLEVIMNTYRANLKEAMLMPEPQLKAALMKEAQDLARQAVLLQQQENRVQAELNNATQQSIENENKVLRGEQERAALTAEEAVVVGAAVPPTVPPRPPAPPVAAMPEEPEPEKKRSELQGLTELEKQYVASKMQERLLEEQLTQYQRDKIRQQATLNDLQGRVKAAVPGAETDAAFQGRLDKLKEAGEYQEAEIRKTNINLEAQQRLLAAQQAITKEIKARMGFEAQEQKIAARSITDPAFLKLSQKSNELITAKQAGESEKVIKKITKELEAQLKVVDSIIARQNLEARNYTAIAQQSTAQLVLEKERLNVLEKEAAAKQTAYANLAQQTGGAGGAAAEKVVTAEAEAAAAQRLVTAQQEVVLTTEMKARADQQAASSAQANVSAMRQQASAADATSKAFGEGEKATHKWIDKVFSLRHVVSSFFGMSLSLIGYGLFAKMQEIFAGLQEQMTRTVSSIQAVRGAIEQTQRSAAQGVSFDVKPGTTVDQFTGDTQEWLKYLDEFKVRFRNLWSSDTLRENFANLENLTRELGLTKEQMQQLLEASGVFAIIDRDMAKANNDIGASSELLARVLQGQIRGIAKTAIENITPQQQASKARELGYQKEWENLNKLSGAEASHVTALVNLAIITERMNPRMQEANERLNTMQLRFRENSARAEDWAQVSRAAFDFSQMKLNLETAWQDLLKPVQDPKILVDRFVGAINDEFEVQMLEGKWGDLTDQQVEGIRMVLTDRAKEFATQHVFRDAIFGGFVLDTGAAKNAGQVVQELTKQVSDEWQKGALKIVDASEVAGSAIDKFIKKVAQLPDIDFPDLTDALQGVDEKKLEDKENALADYYKKLRQNGEKQAQAAEDNMSQHSERITEIAERLTEKLAEIEEKRTEDIAQAGQDLQDKLDEIEKKRLEDEQTVTSSKKNKYLEAEIDHRRKIEDIITDHYRRLKDINDQYLFDLDQAAADRNARQALQLMRQNKFNIAKENEAYAQRRADEDLNYQRKLEDLARQQVEEDKQRKKDYDKQIREAREAYEKQLHEIEKNTQKQIDQAIKDREKQMREENKAFDKRRKAIDQQKEEDDKQAWRDHNDKLMQINQNADDEIRHLARAWQKKYKLDSEQLKLVYDQLKSYYGPGGYLPKLMDWWSQYITNVPTSPGATVPTTTQPGEQHAPGTGPVPFAGGGSFVATRPTMIMVGEGRAPERVTVTPLSGMNASWSGRRQLDIRITADEHFSQDFEDRVLSVLSTEVYDAIRD